MRCGNLQCVPVQSQPPSIWAALRHLRDTQLALLQDVAESRRVLWIGSAISRDEVPAVPTMIERVLLHLRDRAAVADATDPYFGSLTRIVDRHLPTEVRRLERDGFAWAPRAASLDRASIVYDEILGEDVDGEAPGYLIWTALDLCAVYGDPAILPGCEHVLVAILAAERAACHAVTTNWDGLIERAVAGTTPQGENARLAVRMANDDFREPSRILTLYKPHGCAARALSDATYQQYIVATKTDIAAWESAPRTLEVRRHLEQLARNQPSLMLGLSVRDYNLLATLAQASQDHPWTWDSDHPAYVFAARGVEPDHRRLLQLAYDGAYLADRAQVESASVAGFYSGHVLAALCIDVVARKLTRLLALATDFTADTVVLQCLKDGLTRLERDFITAMRDSVSQVSAAFVGTISPIHRLYAGHVEDSGQEIYEPLFPGSILDVADNQIVRSMRLTALAVALALLGVGRQRNLWRVRTSSEASGLLELSPIAPGKVGTPGRSALRLIVVRDAEAADSVMDSALWRDAVEPIVMLHATGTRPASPSRSPGRGIGSARKRRVIRQEAWLSGLAPSSGSMDGLLDAFRREVTV